MSVGKLTVKQAFGVARNSKNCLTFSDEHHIVYVGGHHAVVMNTDTKEQQVRHEWHGAPSIPL